MVETTFAHQRSAGVTFVELLLVFTLLGILASFSLSFMSSTLHRNQLRVVADEIKGAIRVAKMEALIKERFVTLAPLKGQLDWSNGMQLWVDQPDKSSSLKPRLIREWQWIRSAIHVSWHGFESSRTCRFSPNLMARSANGYFLLEDPLKHRLKLIVNRIGRVREESLKDV